MGFIYTLTCMKTWKSYNGQTIGDIHKRFKKHQNPNGCVLIYRAIKNYGWGNFITDYYECPDEDLDKHERWMIRVMGTLAPGGYNLTEGGLNGKKSEITKQRMSEAHIGKVLTEEHKMNMSEAQKGEKSHWYGKVSEKTPFYGKTHNEESKKKMSEAKLSEKHPMYGKTHTEESKKKMSEAHMGEKNHKSKQVYQYDMNGKYIQSFISCREAGMYLKKAPANISSCARGGREKAYDFRWSYEKKVCL